MKKILLVSLICLLSACANSGSSNNGAKGCNDLTNKSSSAHSNSSIVYIYDQCMARDKKAKDDDSFSFIDMIFNMLWSSID